MPSNRPFFFNLGSRCTAPFDFPISFPPLHHWACPDKVLVFCFSAPHSSSCQGAGPIAASLLEDVYEEMKVVTVIFSPFFVLPILVFVRKYEYVLRGDVEEVKKIAIAENTIKVDEF